MPEAFDTDEYKDYTARIKYDSDDKIYVGHLSGIQDIVAFHSETKDGVDAVFRETVESYLELSLKEGRPPQKPIPY